MKLTIAALVWGLMMFVPGAASAETSPTTFASRAIASECGLIRSGDDYWLCVGLSDGPCEVATGDRYALCRAVSQNQCSLTSNTRDYWFCTSMKQRTCGVNMGSRDYWLCESVVRGNCSLNSGSDDYWWCQAMKAPLRRWFGMDELVEEEPVPPSGYVI
jgi:hypothetical protein